MSFLRKLFKLPPAEQWRLVISLENGIESTMPPKEEGILYYHLFESDRKNRKVEFSCTIKGVRQETIENVGKTFELYQTKIYRWLNGRADPSIPSYDDAGVEDTFNILKGKINS